MNTQEFIVQLAKRLQKPQNEMRLGLNLLLNRLRRLFAEQGVCTIRNFGTFFVHKRQKRHFFVPLRKRVVWLPPKLVLRFRAARALRRAVQEEKR